MRPSSLVLALVAAAACRGGEPVSSSPSNEGAPPGSPNVSESPAAPIVVRVALDPSVVAADGRLRITVTATNTTSAARTLHFSSGCTTDYEVLDTSGAVVATSMQMCAQALTQETLAPGASLTGTHVLARGMLGMAPSAAGVYRVRGVLLTTGEPVRSEPVAVTFR